MLRPVERFAVDAAAASRPRSPLSAGIAGAAALWPVLAMMTTLGILVGLLLLLPAG
jgi:hypothetical protein